MIGERILVIDDRVPHVDVGAGDPRAALLARALRRVRPDAEIVWAAVSDDGADRYAPVLEAIGVEVRAGDVERSIVDRTGEFDAVIVSRPHNHRRVRDLLDRRQPQAVRIYDAESLFHRRSRREAAVTNSLVAESRAGDEVAAEAAAVLWADGVVAVAEDVVAFVRAINPEAEVAVCRHAVAVPSTVPDHAARADLVYFGGFLAGPGSPNEDAAVVAAEVVAPEVGRPLVIAGAVPTARVLALEGPRTRVVGAVDDPVAFLAGFRVHLCPLRFGSGLKLRLVDACAAGTPTVMTPCAAENLGLDPATSALLVAEGAAEQAGLARALLEDPARWAAASDAVRALARARFTDDAFDASLDRLLRSLAV